MLRMTGSGRMLKLSHDLPGQTVVISRASLAFACAGVMMLSAPYAVASAETVFYFLSCATIFFVSSSMSISLRGLKGRGMFCMRRNNSRLRYAVAGFH